MKTFSKALLVIGLVMIGLSFMLRAANQPGSPEETVSTLNIGLGALMVLLGSGYLFYRKKKNDLSKDQPSAMKAKGGQDSKNSQSTRHVY